MRLGRLVEYLHAFANGGRIFHGQLYASCRVANMDERARLTARAVNGQRMADGGLHQEAVEHRTVVAVVVETVDEVVVQLRLGRLCAPDDALMQVGYAHVVVAVVEIKQQRI